MENQTKAKDPVPGVKIHWVVIPVFIFLCILTFLFWWFFRFKNFSHQNERVKIETHKLASYLKNDINNRIKSLNRKVSRWENRNGIPKEEFVKDSQNYIYDMPGFQAIQWADSSYRMRWVVPLKGNEKVLSLNIAFEEERRIALEKARKTKKPVMTNPINLVQGGKGFIIYFPLYVNQRFEGFVIAVIKISHWLNYILRSSEGPEHFNKYRIIVTFKDSIVYKQPKWDEYKKLGMEVAHALKIKNSHFYLHCRPTEIFMEETTSFLPEAIAGIGFFMSILVSYIVFMFLSAHQEAWKTKIIKNDLEDEIQGRKLIEKSLKETSTRLSLATKVGRVGIWSWEILDEKLILDDTMYDLYGIHNDVLPTIRTWRKLLHPDDKERTIKLIEDALEGTGIFETEYKIITDGGEIRYLYAAARVERDENNKPERMIGVNWDISEVKRIEKVLKTQTEMQEILMHISSKYINIPLDKVDNAINLALSEIGTFVDADRVYVFDYDFEENLTRNLYEWCNRDIKPQIQDLQAVPMEGLDEWIELHKAGTPLVIKDLSSLPEGFIKDVLTPQEIKSLVTVPMKSRDRLMGFVGFDWVKKHHDTSEMEIDLLKFFSQILVNTRLRQVSEKVLFESRKRFDLALKGTKAGLWDWQIQTGEVLYNERWAEMIGYRLSELEPVDIKTREKLWHTEDLVKSNELLQDHFEGKAEFYECEARVKHKNGEWVWIVDRGQVVEWDKQNNPVRMIGTHIDITERKKSEEMIRHMANHDVLTDLPTMRLAKDRAIIATERSFRNKTMSAFMFIDLDGFKEVNDSFGHETGDLLLKEVAGKLVSSVRKSDTVARIGGDEFLIIINEFLKIEDVERIAEKIIKVISQRFTINMEQMRIGASIGISIYPRDGEDLDILIKKADSAMYKIKHSGKNRYCFAS